MMNITDELIEKFLSGDCTKEEAAIVAGYLKNNPDERTLLNDYSQADKDTPLPQGYQEDMLGVILEKTAMDETSMGIPMVERRPLIRRLRPLWYWAAAAAVILIFKSWFSLQPQMKASGEKLASIETPEASWLEKANTGEAEILFTLPDSSKVRLLPGSRIHYRKGFGEYAQRDIRITGKAFFDVAKNQKMPFTLYNDGLRTRVLGTTFNVNANPYSDKIIIKLITGKVLVTLEGEVKANEQKDYYLTPGQELVFSRSTRDISINDPRKHTEEPVVKVHLPKPDTISNWYMFNNQTLAEVFDQLSAIYNVDIEYSRDDIRNMYFIGKLEKKDSLNEIIQDIALLNHLSVTSLNGKYIIKKVKP